MKKAKGSEPWLPAHYDPPDVYAIQAVALGTATDAQQKRAMKWIIEALCDTYGMSYRPESVRDSDFAEGKRFVGNQIVKLTKLSGAVANKEETNGRR